jgi:hypothetical protein
MNALSASWAVGNARLRVLSHKATPFQLAISVLCDVAGQGGINHGFVISSLECWAKSNMKVSRRFLFPLFNGCLA